MAVLKIKDGNNWIEITGLTGPAGPQGQQGPAGEQGATGATGNGIAQAVLNSDYTLTLIFTDGNSTTVGPIRGLQGPQGNPGANGADGATPVRGTDYWTQADIQAIEADLQTYINTQLGVVENGTY